MWLALTPFKVAVLGGRAPMGNALLLEDGTPLLLEDGTEVLME